TTPPPRAVEFTFHTIRPSNSARARSTPRSNSSKSYGRRTSRSRLGSRTGTSTLSTMALRSWRPTKGYRNEVTTPPFGHTWCGLRVQARYKRLLRERGDLVLDLSDLPRAVEASAGRMKQRRDDRDADHARHSGRRSPSGQASSSSPGQEGVRGVGRILG